MKLDDIFGVGRKKIFTTRDVTEAIDAVLPHYVVYRLLNHSKKIIYHGVTKNLTERLDKHKNKDVKSTSTWNFSKEKIDVEVVEKKKSQSKASEIAHNLEDSYKYQDYNNINTRGI